MRLLRTVSVSERRAERRISGSVRACAHCGQPVPGSRARSDYCCAGCEAVASLLRERGLTRFYDLGGRAAGAVGAVPRAPRLDWLHELEAGRTDAGGTVRLDLDVQGIRCAACVWLLQELFRQHEGRRAIRIDPSAGRVELVYDRTSGAGAKFVTAAARLGYPMAPAGERGPRDIGLLIRLGICAALAANVMILEVAQYLGLKDEGGALNVLFDRVSFAMGTLAVAVGGPVFFRAAWAGMRRGILHLDLPISLGMVLAYAGSVQGFISGGSSYFDTLAIFVALMLVGRFLQQRSLSWNRDRMLSEDASLLRAKLLTAGEISVVPADRLVAGDLVLIAPGDLLVADSRLESMGSFSLDWIDGEATPRVFAAGSVVPAGAFHAGDAPVRGVVVAPFDRSALSRLLARPARPREETRTESPWWHAFARHYSLAVLVLAALGAGVWLLVDPSKALFVAISILVVTCPCALGLASPLALHLVLAVLRAKGVFVRHPTLLERLQDVRDVVFDKTGTVTFGGLRASATAPPPEDALPILATMVSSSNHPASRAVAEWIGRGARFLPELSVREIPGEGVEAAREGHVWRLGRRSFAAAGQGGEPAGSHEPAAADRDCVFAVDGRMLASFRLDEDFRADIAEEIEDLRARGLAVHLLSGDDPSRVEEAAARLRIPIRNAMGGMSPDEKARYIETLGPSRTMMIGDGLNDAPSFELAACAGSPALDRPVLPQRSDFCFFAAHGGSVRRLFEASDALCSIRRSNLALALFYNAFALALCFLGTASPVLCAVLMPISSLVLVANTSLRGRALQRRLA
ncbi:MAG: cation-translocating P-type ATPase [Planctomycetota bacterium]